MNNGLFPGASKRSNILALPDYELFRGIVVTSSVTFRALVDGWYSFYVVGAGGSGGAVFRATAGYHHQATGGAGAGFSYIKKYLKAGQRVIITLGSGGASVVLAAVGNTNGNSGGITTVLSDDFSISITGGEGGKTAYAINTVPTSCAAAIGGIASGGSINYNGGSSGAVGLQSYTGGNTLCVTGGAASGSPLGNGVSSGSILASSSGLISATGGASIRQASIDAGSGIASGGAGMGSANSGIDGGAPYNHPTYLSTATTTVASLSGEITEVVKNGVNLCVGNYLSSIVNPFKRLVGAGSRGATNANSLDGGPGAGSGVVSVTTTSSLRSGHGGTCAGSGAVLVNGAASNISVGEGGIGAGGGGIVSYGGGANVTSGKGGNAFCFIEMEPA